MRGLEVIFVELLDLEAAARDRVLEHLVLCGVHERGRHEVGHVDRARAGGEPAREEPARQPEDEREEKMQHALQREAGEGRALGNRRARSAEDAEKVELHDVLAVMVRDHAAARVRRDRRAVNHRVRPEPYELVGLRALRPRHPAGGDARERHDRVVRPLVLVEQTDGPSLDHVSAALELGLEDRRAPRLMRRHLVLELRAKPRGDHGGAKRLRGIEPEEPRELKVAH